VETLPGNAGIQKKQYFTWESARQAVECPLAGCETRLGHAPEPPPRLGKELAHRAKE